MRFSYAAAAFLAAICLVSEALAGPAPTLPDTAAGREAAKVIASLESDHAARAALVSGELTAAARAGTPPAEWLRFLDKLAEESGGLVPVALSASAENFTVLDMRAKKTPRFVRFYLATARETDAGKIADFGTLLIRDPVKVAADAWPEKKLSDVGVAREIDLRARRLAGEGLLSGAILVARGNRIVYAKAFGESDKSAGTPNRPDTAFNLASMGKMFTAVAIGQLSDAGALSLDDTLARWLPDYPDRKIASAITIRQLLMHTSGLGDFFGADYAAHRDAYATADSYIPLIAKTPPAFAPGARFGYSNSGYALLGVIVERASHETFDDYLREHVFALAGMKASGYSALDEVVPNRAVGYALSPEDPLGVEPRHSNIMTIAYKGNGAGGAYASATDVFRFARALQTGRLMKRETTALFTTPKIDFPGTPHPEKYGYGFTIGSCEKKSTLGHSGGGPNSGVSSNLYAFADGSWTIVVLTNYDPPVGDDFAFGLCGFLAKQ